MSASPTSAGGGGGVVVPSPTNAAARRHEYSHLFALMHRFHPDAQLPLCQQVVHLIHEPIDTNLDEQASALTQSTYRYSDGATAMTTTTTTTTASAEANAAVALIESTFVRGMDAMVKHAKNGLHAAAKVTRYTTPITATGAQHDTIDWTTKWEITLPAGATIGSSSPPKSPLLKSAASPSSATLRTYADSVFFIHHKVLKRTLPSAIKMQEARSRITYTQQKRAPIVRLDYLHLDETTVPPEVYALKGEKDMVHMQLAHSSFVMFPPVLLQQFAQLQHLNLTHNKSLFALPAALKELRQLHTLDLTDCSNLISLPLELTELRNSLEEVHLFGCTNLQFPPHNVTLRLGLGLQVGQSKAGVMGLLDFLADPLSFLRFSMRKRDVRPTQAEDPYPLLGLTVVSHRVSSTLGITKFVEYEVQVTYKEGKKQWSVFQRFSNWHTFHEELPSVLPAPAVAFLPSFPDKTFSLHDMSEDTVTERTARLDAFVKALSTLDLRNRQRTRDEAEGHPGHLHSSKPLADVKMIREFFALDKNLK